MCAQRSLSFPDSFSHVHPSENQSSEWKGPRAEEGGGIHRPPVVLWLNADVGGRQEAWKRAYREEGSWGSLPPAGVDFSVLTLGPTAVSPNWPPLSLINKYEVVLPMAQAPTGKLLPFVLGTAYDAAKASSYVNFPSA